MPPSLVIVGGVGAGVCGARYYMMNQEWFEQKIAEWKESAPAIVSTLQGLGVLQIALFVWSAMLQTLFYGAAAG